MIKLEAGLSRLKECYLFTHLTYSILSVTCLLEWLKSTQMFFIDGYMFLWAACLIIILALIPAQHVIITKTFFQDTKNLVLYKIAYTAAICILYIPIFTGIFAEGNLGVLIIVPVVLNSIICGTVYGLATSLAVATTMAFVNSARNEFFPELITSHILTLAVLAITAWFIGQSFEYIKNLLYQLSESERDHRDLLDKLGIATLYLDSSHQIIDENQCFRDLMGIKEHNSLSSERIINYHLPFIKEYLKDNSAHSFNEIPVFGQACDSLGNILPVQCVAYPTNTDLKDKKGLVLCINDISLSEKLEEEKIKTNLFIDFLNSGLILSDATGKIIEINRQAEVLMNKSKAEAINNNMTDLLTSVAGKPLDPTALKKSGFEIQLDGKTLLVNWADLRKSSDKIIGSACIINDITDQKEMERKMHRSATLSAIGELAAGTAHEIRNPLTSIRGFLQFLLEKKDAKIGKYESYFAIMLNEVDRINTIITEFLKLAKPEKVKLNPVNLNDVVLSIWELLKNEALLKDIQLELALDQALNPIMGNRDMLKQVIINLVSNAFQATGPGGTVQVTTSAEENGAILLSVHDSGPGMDESILAKIFDPFFTTRDEGTGLGLAITSKIVDDHNAIINVTSSPSQGTTFYVKFPPPVDTAG
ncbi:ATP-binding protein [Desulfotruncus alcoholivorax]|uniref:ATP-binding protein n=1 Tax=Desulfotruncus alcoholivorax TaxID=265477 RepID=UPI00041C1B06|nr:ATP-binding protein [Desulfotruncus alcoholivorax]